MDRVRAVSYTHLQATGKAAPSAVTTTVERRRTVPPRGNGSKLEEVGAPLCSKAIANTQHRLRLAGKREVFRRSKF